MMTKTNELILYRNSICQGLFNDFTWIMEHHNSDYYNQEDIKALLFETINELVELASAYGFEGNLWHNYLAFLIANNENAFSTACEIVGKVNGSINELAKHDFRIFYSLFKFDLKRLDSVLETTIFSVLEQYTNVNENSKIFNKRIRDQIKTLSVELAKANDEENFLEMVTTFYKHFGVGKFGLHKAFRIADGEEDTIIHPITNVEHVYLNDIVGYQLQKDKLITNTLAFIEGKEANNVLLYGDSGTGKSSSIKAILNEYYDRGLRMIELYKHQFQDLSRVIEQIKDRNYKFIIYMDDLSFEDFETEYKYLKAIIEGGLGKKPKNVLIYATSNRRHLVREKFSDKRETQDDLHGNDTVQEKLSLVARFGVTIYYGSPDKKEFQRIVKNLADRHGVVLPEDVLYMEANKWELSHGGLSGRTAAQFITHLLGEKS